MPLLTADARLSRRTAPVARSGFCARGSLIGLWHGPPISARSLVSACVSGSVFESGHEIVFLYSGRLEPEPASMGASLTESDGSIGPLAWRPLDDAHESLPLYPAEAVPWVRRLRKGR